MNLLSRTFAELLSSPSARQRLIPHPALVLHPFSSLYSTTATSTATAASSTNSQSKPKYRGSKPTPPPPPPPSSSSRSSPAADTHQNIAVFEREEFVSSVDEYDWPRPGEIPWQAKVANSVNLIGRLQMPVQSHSSSDGKFWAGSIITQDPTSHSPSLWIPIIFEGDLAHIAACHLKENDYIHIGGQLNTDPQPFTINQGQANVQVIVHSIDFVQESSEMKKTFAPRKREGLAFNYSASVKNDISVNQLWKDLLAKPHEWWDIRLEKGDSMGAAFERKDDGALLWMIESTPEWIRQKLESLTFDRKIVQKIQNTASVNIDGNSVLSLWRDLLNNPKQWWDYREDKRSGSVKPKHPDFKHKDGRFPLWINTAPVWVLSGLEGLEFDSPIHKTKQVKDHKGDESWKNLVENPDKWWDNRSNKINEKSPDFKHKDTREGLWLSDSPTWVLSKLPPAKTKLEAAIVKRDTLLS
ncbi:hypothetical protein L1049_021789 [Liquidambar formosana]|uniref:Uncharacterized protein n=1 Tax=Liquidambar formosana TaxID=63359 RepID=A0AAP0WQ26_LIQFO